MNFREKRLFQRTDKDIAEINASTIAADVDLTVEDPVGYSIDDLAVPMSRILREQHRFHTIEDHVGF